MGCKTIPIGELGDMLPEAKLLAEEEAADEAPTESAPSQPSQPELVSTPLMRYLQSVGQIQYFHVLQREEVDLGEIKSA